MNSDNLDKALNSMKEHIKKLKIKNNERETPLRIRSAIEYTIMNKAEIRKPIKVEDVSVETGLYPIENSFDVEVHDKISVKHRMKQSEMKKYVCNGAKLKCPYLEGELKLNVFQERLIFVKYEPIATSEDCNKENFSIDFISGTGKCSKTENDCLKCIDAYWKKDTLAPYVFLNGAQPVLKTSILKCRIDENIDIKVIKSGQNFGNIQGIKNVLLQFHDENPWMIRVFDGQINRFSGIKTGIAAIGAFKIHPHLAIELLAVAEESYYTGEEQIREGLINSPLGFIYEPIYKNFSDPIRDFNWGNPEKNDKKKDFLETEKEELKNSAIITVTEDIQKQNTTSAKSFFLKYIKDRMQSKVIEYRRPIYDYMTKKNNDLSNTIQVFVPTKEYSDNTIDFLNDPYITVIIENKK